MTTSTYLVTGLTCAHCSQAVTTELTKLDGVSDVTVDLEPDGVSRVTVTGDTPLPDQSVSGALEQAGGYRLAPS